MTRWPVVLSLVLLYVACHAQQGDQNLDEELPDDYFSDHTKCITAWRELISDWRSNGGGIRNSILETRKQIAGDERSKFSEIIRRSWSRQKEKYAEDIEEFGHWPVTHEQFRRATFPLVEVLPDYLPKSCSTVSWMLPLIWDELRFVDADPMNALRPVEVPGTMKWDSVSAPNWTSYWLLVRID